MDNTPSAVVHADPVQVPVSGSAPDSSISPESQQTLPLSSRVVPASPIAPPPQDQGVPAHEDAARPHLMGRLTGKLISGLSGEHTEYSIDPNTGKSVPTTVKDKPGSVFKSILAYGLMGGQGIGPKEGEQNFAQGLLAGLGGGVKTSMDENQKLDQQRRAQAQTDYANQLKANEEGRQNKELDMKQKEMSMKQQLNEAAIANYTAQTSMEKFNLMKAHQENQHMAVQQMQAKDLPMVTLSEQAGIKPIKEGLTTQEYQKLLADPNSPEAQDVRSHKAIPLVTNSQAHVNADGSLSWEPTISLYPVATKYTADTLSQLKDAGMTNTPLYRDVEQKVKNGSAVEPRELLNVYKEIGQHFDYAKNRADIAEKQAQQAEAYARANEAGVQAQLGKLNLDQAKSAQQGKELYSYIGSKEGFTRTDPKTKKTETITIPSDGNGGFDFSQLNPKEKAGLRDYTDVVQNTAQLSLDKLIAASKADPENKDVLKQIKEQSSAVSSLNNIANSLNGTKNFPKTNSGDLTTDKIDRMVGSHANKLTGDASDVFTKIAKTTLLQGKDLSSALKLVDSLVFPDPGEKIAVANELIALNAEYKPLATAQSNEQQKASEQVQKASYTAYQQEHPELNPATASFPTVP